MFICMVCEVLQIRLSPTGDVVIDDLHWRSSVCDPSMVCALTLAGPLSTQREHLFDRLCQAGPFDVAVIGGGATGAGIALEAAVRGYSTVLLEAHDLAKGTSSRATKLVHGGVRYLAQGQWSLVRDALHERQYFFDNAPHLAQPLSFVIPAYQRWDQLFYGLGLRLYDAMAGQASAGKTRWLSAADVHAAVPTLNDEGLCGGIRYWDGQFDDARMVLAVVRTAALKGACVLNHCPVTGLIQHQGQIQGLTCRDVETGITHEVMARCVINATGVWSDTIQQWDPAQPGHSGQKAVQPSQGAHMVVDRSFWPSSDALLIPRTSDGRVLFAIPWMGATLLGTTDTARTDVPIEPRPTTAEVDFILQEIGAYLQRKPRRSDIKSLWAGLRPLVRPSRHANRAVSAVSREHAIEVSPSGLVSVTGGKWTTYRLMAEQVLSASVKAGLLTAKLGSTVHLPLVGASRDTGHRLGDAPGYHLYGSEQAVVKSLPGAAHWLAPGVSEAMVRFAARHEYARTVEDVLARRARLLFLDAAAARQAAPLVGDVLMQELGRDPEVAAFEALCGQYLA